VIYFNDRPVVRAGELSLEDLLKLVGRETPPAAVTVDGEFVPPAEYKKFPVSDGARVRAWELLDGG